MQEPTVSVIIPCYNSAPFIAETVDKLMLQTYKSIQVILIDDGSSDNTNEIAQRLSNKYNKVSCIKSGNVGPGIARNKGMELANGKYIQFLDADDYLHPEKIKEQVDFLEQNPSIDLVYADSLFFDHNKPDIFFEDIHLTQKKWMPKVSGAGVELLQCLVHGNIFTICSPLVKASLVSKIGGFNVSYFAMEDHEFWLRCAINDGRFQYHKNALAISYVRVHPKSLSKDLSIMYKYASMLRMYMNTVMPTYQLHMINALYNLKMNIAIVVKGYTKKPLLFITTVILNLVRLKNTYYHISNE